MHATRSNLKVCFKGLSNDRSDGDHTTRYGEVSLQTRDRTILCRWPRCPHSIQGFSAPVERAKHEHSHVQPFRCPRPTCEFAEDGLPSRAVLRRHVQKYHEQEHEITIPKLTPSKQNARTFDRGTSSFAGTQPLELGSQSFRLLDASTMSPSKQLSRSITSLEKNRDRDVSGSPLGGRITSRDPPDRDIFDSSTPNRPPLFLLTPLPPPTLLGTSVRCNSDSNSGSTFLGSAPLAKSLQNSTGSGFTDTKLRSSSGDITQYPSNQTNQDVYFDFGFSTLPPPGLEDLYFDPRILEAIGYFEYEKMHIFPYERRITL